MKKPTLLEVSLVTVCVVSIAATMHFFYQKDQPTKGISVPKVEHVVTASAGNKKDNSQQVKTTSGGIEYDFVNVNRINVVK